MWPTLPSCGRPATTADAGSGSAGGTRAQLAVPGLSWRYPGSDGGTRALSGQYSAPAGQQAPLHILDRDGVAEMVPPRAVDVQVAAAQALLVEAELFHDAPARVVLRSDARLDPVQPHH